MVDVRAPVEADLRTEVELLRCPGADAGFEGDACQQAGSAAEPKHAHIVVFVGKRADIRVAHSGTQREVGTHLPIVLEEDAEYVFAIVVAVAARNSGGRLERTSLCLRRIVQKIPEIVEGVIRISNGIVQIVKPGEIESELHGLGLQNLGGDVLVPIGPLIQMPRGTHAHTAHSDISNLVDIAVRQSEWRLGIAGELIVTPAGCVGTRFVEEGWREDVIPDDGKRIVDLRVIEELVAEAASVGGGAVGHPVDGEAGMILAGHVGVETAIVLLEVAAGRVARAVLGQYPRRWRARCPGRDWCCPGMSNPVCPDRW